MPDVMILAAGLGTRMKSSRAKVLHELLGRPMISYIVRTVSKLAPEAVIVVVGHQADEVERAVRQELVPISSGDLHFVRQIERKGTGHAVMAARGLLEGRSGPLIVVAGDGPMLKAETLGELLDRHTREGNDATMLTACMDEPSGYGRIVRDPAGAFIRCVEEKDATPDELKIQEVGVSIYCFNVAPLLDALDRLGNDNAQGEYYLTDVPQILLARGHRVGILLHGDPRELIGINTRVELADVERRLRESKLTQLMLSGVTIVDPGSTYIHADVEIGRDTVIDPQVIIEGRSRIGADTVVQSWTRLKDVDVGDGVTIKNCCVVEDSRIEDGATVGPFARLRMGAEIGPKAGIGNFVEVKKSKVGRGTKASHLTYLGDATIGDRVNIGAGTVTCNYDGVRKHETIIEDDVKIGSDTMLVAPVRVGQGSVTGAGAVVTKDIPPKSLATGVPARVIKKLQ